MSVLETVIELAPTHAACIMKNVTSVIAIVITNVLADVLTTE